MEAFEIHISHRPHTHRDRLSDGSATSIYGTPAERLYGQHTSVKTWYSVDALNSVRALLDDAGLPLAGASYDAWGVPETAAIAPFGFTGELQRGNDVWLRARWYGAGRGGFGARDAFEGWAETPYSLHYYQYAYSNPGLWTDPSGLWLSPFRDEYNSHEPVDIGILVGASVSGAIAPLGTATMGIEWVFDLHDFEVAIFTYKGGASTLPSDFSGSQWSIQAGISRLKSAAKSSFACPLSVGVSLYVGMVKGWSHQKPRGIHNYSGKSVVSSASVSFPQLPFFTGNVQYFESENRSMQGVTVGLGLSTDLLPVNISREILDYSSPIMPQYFHAGRRNTWTPPTKTQEAQFKSFVNTKFASQIWIVGPILAGYMRDIIEINGQRWRNTLQGPPSK